jgi:methyltransferase
MVTSQWAYAAFIALLGLERLGELGLSTRHARQAFAAGAVEVGRGHFRVMSAMHTAFLLCCLLEVFALNRAFPGRLGWICLVGALVAQALRYWAILTLGNRWSVRIIVWPGAAPVSRGPYRLVRHPNYVAVILEMICIPLVHGAWVTALVFSAANAVVLRVRIREEEAALGQAYAQVFSGRPRFFPALRRSSR